MKDRGLVVFVDQAHHAPDGRLEKALVERPYDVGNDGIALLSKDGDAGRRLVEVFWVVKPLVVFRDPAYLLHLAIKPVDTKD